MWTALGITWTILKIRKSLIASISRLIAVPSTSLSNHNSIWTTSIKPRIWCLLLETASNSQGGAPAKSSLGVILLFSKSKSLKLEGARATQEYRDWTNLMLPHTDMYLEMLMISSHRICLRSQRLNQLHQVRSLSARPRRSSLNLAISVPFNRWNTPVASHGMIQCSMLLRGTEYSAFSFCKWPPQLCISTPQPNFFHGVL
jgi:hypothetical protein